MKFFTKCALAASVLSVSACDLIRDEIVVNGEVVTSAMLPGDIYVPVVNDGETSFIAQIEGDGVPGFIGNSDGTVSQVLIRVSPDRMIAYVSADGGPERAFENRTYYFGSTTYFSGDYSDGSRTVYIGGDEYNTQSPRYWSYHGEEGRGAGFYGFETPTDALPTEAAIYSGRFGMAGDTLNLEGQMSMEVDFASGDIDGVFMGNYGNGFMCCFEGPTLQESGSVLGQIDGSISGSRVAGSAFVTSGAEGTFDFMGGVYGETGEQVAGGIAGTLTTGTTDHAMGGEFLLRSDNSYFYYD